MQIWEEQFTLYVKLLCQFSHPFRKFLRFSTEREKQNASYTKMSVIMEIESIMTVAKII